MPRFGNFALAMAVEFSADAGTRPAQWLDETVDGWRLAMRTKKAAAL
jgi:hypothetical protein